MTVSPTLLRTLPYVGALPFLGSAVLLTVGTKDIPVFGNITSIMLAYGLTIVSFMAGVQWGQYVSGVRAKFNLLVSSNAVALAAWSSYILLKPRYVCLAFVVLFATLYFIDTQLNLEQDYVQTRRNVTLIVSASLVLAAWL